MDGLWIYLMLVLAVVVIPSAVIAVGMWSGLSDRPEKGCVVLPVSGHVEDIELRVRAAVFHRRRTGTEIYIADFGADAETAEIAHRLCLELDAVEWMTAAELFVKLNEMASRNS